MGHKTEQNNTVVFTKVQADFLLKASQQVIYSNRTCGGKTFFFFSYFPHGTCIKMDDSKGSIETNAPYAIFLDDLFL